MSIVTFLLISWLSLQDCNCKSVEKNRQAEKAWMSVVLAGEQKLAVANGKVIESNGDPLASVLVEVLSHPAPVKRKSGEIVKKTPVRVEACETAEDGKFCFKELKPGKYELRLSRKSFNTVSIRIELVNQTSQSTSEMILVTLPVSH